MIHSHIEVNLIDAALCASVGGFGAILSEGERVLASTQLLIPTTPTYPPDVTGINQASVILATATPAPDLGNPATPPSNGFQVYPPCAVSLMTHTRALRMTDMQAANLRQRVKGCDQ